jgi:hypothetical protein
MPRKLKRLTQTFDEFLHDCRFNDKWQKAKQASSVNTGADALEFTGSNNYDEAIELALHGYPEGVQWIKDGLDQVGAKKGLQLEPVYDLAGDEADLDRYLSGEPENMVTYEYSVRGGVKFLDVYFSYAYACSQDQPEIIKRGVDVLSNIDSLENNNFRIRLIAYFYSSKKKQPFLHEIIIKDYQEQIELDRMSLVMVHPSMLRRLGFRIVEIYAPTLTTSGYGTTTSHHFDEIDGIDVGGFTFSTEAIETSFNKYTEEA